MKTLQIGDVVRLKSGGPLMTVEGILDEKVYCTWFSNEQSERSHSMFIIDCLELG